MELTLECLLFAIMTPGSKRSCPERINQVRFGASNQQPESKAISRVQAANHSKHKSSCLCNIQERFNSDMAIMLQEPLSRKAQLNTQVSEIAPEQQDIQELSRINKR